MTTTTRKIEYVDPCPGMKGTDVITETCTKCGGTGFIQAFTHVYAGECFDCNGHGNHQTTVKSIRGAEHRRVNDHNKAVEAEENAVAYLNQHPKVAQAFDTLPLADDFAASLKANLFQRGHLTEKQEAALIKAAELETAKIEAYVNATDCPEGRQTVAGEVLTVKWVSSQYGGSLKMLVKSTDGWKVWGTVPSAISEVERGDKVQFVATVTPSDDDAKFGFYKRPSKAEVIA